MNMYVNPEVRFKVGDRVRPANGDPHKLFDHWMRHWAKPGDTRPDAFYIVNASKSGVTYNVDKYATLGPWINHEDFEPAPLFSVGDRVRFTHKVPKSFWFGPHTKHLFGTVTEEGGGVYRYSVKVDGEATAFVDAEHIEPAPLRIEAGKYYKTRDGRKTLVRSNEAGDKDKWPWYCDINSFHALDAGGKSCTGNDDVDLIAEWPDEHAEEATPTYKIGDRVRALKDDIDIIEGNIYTVNDVNKYSDGVTIRVTDDAGDDWWMCTGTFELVAEDVARFNVGDQVRYKTTTPSYQAEYTDNIMTIMSIGGGDFCDNVELAYGRGYDQTARLIDIELITPNHAIIARIDDGQPKPANQPYVHADTDAAKAEAARLARVNPGCEFGVYELVDTKREARMYEHEWQRLAAEGETVEARKALQLTGLSGIQASRVVQEFVAAA